MSRSLSFACLALSAGLLAGCPDEDALSDRGADRAAPRIRFVQLSPDAPMLDVTVGDVKVSRLAFGSGTDYRPAAAQPSRIRVRSAEGGLLYEDQVTLAPGQDYAFVISGYAEEGFNSLMVNVVSEDKSDIEADFRMQIVHAAPFVGLERMDVWNVSDPNDPYLLAEDLAYTEAAVNDRPDGQHILCLDFNSDAECDQLFAIDEQPSEFVSVYIGNRADEGDTPFVLVHREDGSVSWIDPG